MALEVIEFFNDPDKSYWIEEIRKGTTDACKYLAQLLEEDKLKNLCGPTTEVLMLTENKKIYSLCTLAEQDEIDAPEMTPWIGFVYTFPEYRNHYFATTLLDLACEKAKEQGAEEVFISPPTETRELYEKYGFTRTEFPMTSIYGYETFVYKKELN